MKTGKEIFLAWVTGYFGISPDTAYKGGTVVPTMLNEPDHVMLIGMIDEALREARQEGLDGKKQNTVMKDAGEHGPYWKEFFLKGCVELPGVAEAFNCKREESIWQNQWDEVIRVHFKKPTLRSVDPGELFDFLYEAASMYTERFVVYSKKHDQIISELASVAAVRASAPAGDGVYKDPWG